MRRCPPSPDRNLQTRWVTQGRRHKGDPDAHPPHSDQRTPDSKRICDKLQKKTTKQTYLKGKLSTDVVVRANSRHNVTRQQNTAEDRLLSAVWGVRGGAGRGGRGGGQREREGGGLYMGYKNISHHPLTS